MQYETAFFSHKGKKHENQDSLLAMSLSENELVIAIADGVGGREGGKIAAMTALATLAEQYNENKNISMQEIFIKVKDGINHTANVLKMYKMATTMTVCHIINNNIVVGHVGDCRLYHIRNNGIVTMTKDQSEKQKLIDNGVLSKERALNYHRRNVLYSVISSDTSYEIYESEFLVQSKDRLLLLSDGVYNVCSKKEILNLSNNSNSINDWMNKLNSLVVEKGIIDDYSALALAIE
ncbi:PP2C family protein-serine/threonine phosphatase [Providencia rettgeri]